MGVDPVRLMRFFLNMPWFVISVARFRRKFSGALWIRPCVHDRTALAGSADNEYFIQDLLVAQLVHASNPMRHLDVGSRVDGFVAHVASFRDIEVMDVRPLVSFSERIKFFRHDLMGSFDSAAQSKIFSAFDSISCLHALEHFGLGRYGDTLDPSGWMRGLSNLSFLLGPEGTLYLSTPVGRERVYFNSNWIFSARRIIDVASDLNLSCVDLFKIRSGSAAIRVDLDSDEIQKLDQEDYCLCLFVFSKGVVR